MEKFPWLPTKKIYTGVYFSWVRSIHRYGLSREPNDLQQACHCVGQDHRFYFDYQLMPRKLCCFLTTSVYVNSLFSSLHMLGNMMRELKHTVTGSKWEELLTFNHVN